MLTSFMYGPGQANFVVTTYASSEGSGDPAPRHNLSCSLEQAMSQEEPSDRKPDPWPLWMTGHEQLKFFMTRNARRHKFAWRGPYSCASVNNNKKCAIGRSENERKSVLWWKMFIFVVAYMNMINGAYKDRKAPKYRKATKIPESTYKYQKAMEKSIFIACDLWGMVSKGILANLLPIFRMKEKGRSVCACVFVCRV